MVLGAIGVAWIGGLINLLFLGVGYLVPVALASGALLGGLVVPPPSSPLRRPLAAAAP